jgi:hypothetical protein
MQEGVFSVDDDDEEEEDDEGDDDDMPSWSKLETVNSCHPLYFARMVAEVQDHFSSVCLLYHYQCYNVR